MSKTKRLYIFTGKGGVGKTTLSLAFTKYLKDQGLKAKYIFFENNKLGEKTIGFNDVDSHIKDAEVDHLPLDLYQSAKNYIGKKLNSKTVASWIVKTPFFISLINMIPGFNYLIYLGQILELLDDDKDLILILDSPSSGHAQTMLEATKNFNNIFQSGVIYDDTKRMLNLMREDNFLKINIITLPTILAIHEAKELATNISSHEKYEIETFCNNCLNTFKELELPEFLEKKVANESLALDEGKSHIDGEIPYLIAKNNKELIKELGPSMENLV